MSAWAHEIEISPSSVHRPCRNYLWSTNAWFSFKFWLSLPLGHMLGRFLNFWIFFFCFIFLRIFFVFVNMGPIGAKISKCYSSYKSQPKVFKLVPNFPPYGPHKTTFGIFEILSFWFLTNFIWKFQIHHCSLRRNQKPQLSGQRATIEKNGVIFGTHG